MIYKDKRLANQHDQVNDIHFEKYKTAIAGHPFPEIAQLVNGIVLQLSKRVIQRKKFTGEPYVQSAMEKLSTVLDRGDVFYEELFKREGFVPPIRINEELKPLSASLSNIYGNIWNQKQPFDDPLTVFGFLEDFITELVAKKVASDEQFNGLHNWGELIAVFSNSSPFFHTLIDHLQIYTIRVRRQELAYNFNPANIFNEIEVIDKRNTKEQYSRAYLAEAERLKMGSAWTYVSKLTKDSPYAMFHDILSLKQNLVYRLSLREIIEWIDGLAMPLSQAAAFHSLRDLSQMENFIEQLVSVSKNIRTPFINLLLIALDHYFKLMHEISRNLQNLTGDIHHHDKAVRVAIQSKGRSDYDEWINNGIAKSLESVIGFVFSDQSLLSPAVYQGLFDWVASQDKAQWLANRHEQPIVAAIELLHEKFLQQFKTGKGNKQDLLSAIQADGLYWTKVSLLMSLYQEDPSDQELRGLLTEKLLAYLRSDEFSWNPQYLYHNEVINQACHLAEMLIEGGNTDELLQSISGEFKIWHDGWNYQIGQGFKIFNKQLYVLHVGIAVAYIYFNSGQPEAAQNVFEIYFRLTMQQYRNTVINNYGQHYLLAIRFLIHVLLRFNPDRMEMIVTDIVNQIDDIEDLLIIASGIADTAQLLQVPINTAILQLINTRIDREYWIIESQLKLANHLSKIGEYERVKENYIAYAATQNCI